MPVSKKSISLPTALAAELTAAGPLSTVVTQRLERYAEITRRERLSLRAGLSDAEIGLILDSLNSVAMLDAWSPVYLVHEVADFIRLKKADWKWQVDGRALVAKLNQLEYPARCALADAAARFWRRVGEGENPDPKDALTAS